MEEGHRNWSIRRCSNCSLNLPAGQMASFSVKCILPCAFAVRPYTSSNRVTYTLDFARRSSGVVLAIYVPFGPVACARDDDEDAEFEVDEDGDQVPLKPCDPLPEGEYICPFKALGQCGSKTTAYKDYRALSNHCNQEHRGKIIDSVEFDPFEDGTCKIPCPKRCGGNFSSYHAAHDHAKMPSRCRRPDNVIFPRLCPWSLVPGVDCVYKSDDYRSESAHASVHAKDKRGPSKCHFCGANAADLYQLASHISRCRTEEQEKWYCAQLRLEFPGSTNTSLVIVCRASGAALLSWLSGLQFLHQGIFKYAESRVTDAKDDLKLEGANAIFHAHTKTQTRHIPSDTHNNATKHKHPRFAQDLQLGQKPVLVSVGLDGFACHAPNILPLLKRNTPLTWVIRETESCRGKKERPSHAICQDSTTASSSQRTLRSPLRQSPRAPALTASCGPGGAFEPART
ncbi:hypothetical protein BKA63DRAFT_585709 [Paraphoma chrysanthemicola]|nr:hypothetical protein BKA63DRAFT_585709 [Paraphoma chrysanthemicola]